MKTEAVTITGYERRLVLSYLFFIKKLFAEPESFDHGDELQLWYLTFHFLDKENDKLPKKLKDRKISLVLILRFLRNNQPLSGNVTKARLNNLEFFCKDLILTDHEYYGMKNGALSTGPSKLTVKVLPKKQFKPAPYIGVGYKDKGTCSNPATSGISYKDYMLSKSLSSEETSYWRTDFNSSYDLKLVAESVDDEIEDHILF